MSERYTPHKESKEVTSSNEYPKIHSSFIRQLVQIFHGRVDSLISRVDKENINTFEKVLPVCTLLLWAITTAYFLNVEGNSIAQSIWIQLEKQLWETIYPIQSRIQEYEQSLAGIQGLFGSSSIITRDEYRLFMNAVISPTESLPGGKKFPEVLWTSIAFLIQEGKETGYTSLLRKEWYLDFGMYQKWEHAPITYIEPFLWKNIGVVGFNNFLEPVRKSILTDSQHTGEAVLSDPTHLIQDKAEEKVSSGFLITKPIFGKWTNHSTYAERDANIVGWAIIAFDFQKLIPQVSYNGFSDIHLRIYIKDSKNNKNLIYDSFNGRDWVSQFWLEKQKTVTIANKEWTFIVDSTESLEKSMYYKGYLDIILRSGAMLTFLLTIASYIIIRARKKSLSTIEHLHEALYRNKYLARHDTLTNLPNRSGFLDKLRTALTHADMTGNLVALMFIDLDKFKYINDAYGHPVGDELLRQVTNRMKDCMRANDVIGRQWGDEFLVLIPDLVDPNDATKIALKIIKSLVEPFDIDGHTIYIGCSIGSATYPRDAWDADTLQKCADMAMYQVKHSGRNWHQSFTDWMQQASEEYQLISTALRHALEQEDFFMVYQPVIDLKTGEIVSMEALLRLNHPEFWWVSPSVPPSKFIPIAEKTWLIVPIGKWVIRDVCKKIMQWKMQWIDVPKIAINLSAKQFLSPTLFDDIMQILGETWVSPKEIGLEITEGAFIHDIDKAIGIIDQLANVGFEISLDDFGTVYSSLSYLKQFRKTKILKIDRSFIVSIYEDWWIDFIRTIIYLAHSRGMKTIAEWVESEDVVSVLKELGCDYVQGYVFWRPENADTTAKLLLSSKNDWTKKE